MSLFRRKTPAPTLDPATQQPAMRRSICTGETVAGYIDRSTGVFHELEKVDGPREAEEYLLRAGADKSQIRTIY